MACRGGGAARLGTWIALALAFAACGGGGGSDDGFNPLPNQAPPAQTELGGLVGPEGLTFDASGNLYAGSTTGRITRVSPSGAVSVFAETGRSLAGLATGPQNEIFAAAFGAGEIIGVSQNGVMRVAAFALDSPNAIAFDPNQRMLVSESGYQGFPGVSVIEPDGTYRVLAEDFASPNGLAFGPDGMLYVADTFRNHIVRMTYDSANTILGAPEIYAIGIGLPDGIAFDKAGNLYVAASGQVWVVLPDDNGGNNRSSRPFVVSGDLAGPASLAFGFGSGRDTGRLYFANFGFPSLGSGTSLASTLVGIPGLPLNAP